MAKAAKPIRTPTRATPGGGKRSFVWLSGLLCGAVAAVAPGASLLAGALLAPAIIALKMDHEPGRPIARTVLTFGLAGCVHPLTMLWNAGQSLGTAATIIADPLTIATAWGAAAAGWLLAQIMPLILRVVLEASTRTRASSLRATRSRLMQDWGLDQEDH